MAQKGTYTAYQQLRPEDLKTGEILEQASRTVISALGIQRANEIEAQKQAFDRQYKLNKDFGFEPEELTGMYKQQWMEEAIPYYAEEYAVAKQMVANGDPRGFVAMDKIRNRMKADKNSLSAVGNALVSYDELVKNGGLTEREKLMNKHYLDTMAKYKSTAIPFFSPEHGGMVITTSNPVTDLDGNPVIDETTGKVKLEVKAVDKIIETMTRDNKILIK